MSSSVCLCLDLSRLPLLFALLPSTRCSAPLASHPVTSLDWLSSRGDPPPSLGRRNSSQAALLARSSSQQALSQLRASPAFEPQHHLLPSRAAARDQDHPPRCFPFPADKARHLFFCRANKAAAAASDGVHYNQFFYLGLSCAFASRRPLRFFFPLATTKRVSTEGLPPALTRPPASTTISLPHLIDTDAKT